MAGNISAAMHVLLLPELLEQILIDFFYILWPGRPSTRPSLALLHLRSVSATWRSMIDTSPTLQSLTFRNRQLYNPNGGERYDTNGCFLYWLIANLETSVLRESADLAARTRRQNFENFANRAWNNGSSEFPWMYITKPAVTEVSLYFGVAAYHSRLPGQWMEYKSSSSVGSCAKWKGNRLSLHSATGITTDLILEKIVETLRALYELPGPGSFFICEISMKFGVEEREELDGYDDGVLMRRQSELGDEVCALEYVLF
ncbi:hypothetical protein TWF730_007033 [Orbilia blumenaviensis]|uniref:F-box domain-containing protein n=1 Tax=Orbilia blumenaviensis TaxID=1796055 RepID=A0AAV9VIG0_9PEZI